MLSLQGKGFNAPTIGTRPSLIAVSLRAVTCSRSSATRVPLPGTIPHMRSKALHRVGEALAIVSGPKADKRRVRACSINDGGAFYLSVKRGEGECEG